MLKIELNDNCPSDWNNFLKKNEYGLIYHTEEYANYISRWNKWKPVFFRILSENGEILLQNLFFLHSPISNKIPKKIHPLIEKFKKSYRWYYGPVYSSVDALNEFFNFLQKTKIGFHGNLHPLSKIENFTLDCKKTKWSTFLIDLQKPKKELYDNLSKHSARKNIERAINRGVTIEELTDKSWDDYVSLLGEFRVSQNRNNVNLDESHDFWKSLKKVGFSGFLARINDIPIGGLTFSFFNNHINEWGVARSKKDFQDKLYSQDLIKWKIIEWGIENKMKLYDLSGVNPNPISEKEKGILRYKEKWGGKQYYYWILHR